MQNNVIRYEALNGLKTVVSREILRSQPYFAPDGASKGSTSPFTLKINP